MTKSNLCICTRPRQSHEIDQVYWNYIWTWEWMQQDFRKRQVPHLCFCAVLHPQEHVNITSPLCNSSGIFLCVLHLCVLSAW